MSYTRGNSFTLIARIPKSVVEYLSQPSWGFYPLGSTNSSTHLPRIDVPSPTPVGSNWPRPNVNYAGEHAGNAYQWFYGCL